MSYEEKQKHLEGIKQINLLLSCRSNYSKAIGILDYQACLNKYWGIDVDTSLPTYDELRINRTDDGIVFGYETVELTYSDIADIYRRREYKRMKKESQEKEKREILRWKREKERRKRELEYERKQKNRSTSKNNAASILNGIE